MVRRLQPSTPAATAPAPATAILEPPAPSTTAVAPAQPAAQPQFAISPELQQAFVGAFANKKTEYVEGTSTPYVMFFDQKSEQATKIAQALPHVSKGEPILVQSGAYQSVLRSSFMILDEFQFWCVTDETTYQPIEWRLDAPPAAGDWKEQFLCLLLLVDEEPLLTLTNLRTTKCGVAKTHKKAVDRAETPEAIRADPTLGAYVQAGIPPRLRVTSTFQVTAKPGKRYVAVDARPATTTAPQGLAVSKWFTSPEGQAEHKLLRAAFDEAVASVKKKAAKK